MQCLAKLTYQEKVDILCKVIRRKSRYGISDHSLGIILDNLNVHRPHIIKVTSDYTKFMNIATAEMVFTCERKVLSYVTRIYGDFQCGHFYKNMGETSSLEGTVNHDHDAAVLKRSIVQFVDQPPIITYTLALYERAR